MVEICVAALMLKHNGQHQILLGKRAASRAAYPNVWDMPGGHCEPGETPEQTLIRELQEEIGITPTQWQAAGVVTVPPATGSAELVLHVYHVTAWDGPPINRQPDEHSEIAWFSLAELGRLDLAHPSYPALFRRMVQELES
jgi:8-oxo-dGTP diphosphatase